MSYDFFFISSGVTFFLEGFLHVFFFKRRGEIPLIEPEQKTSHTKLTLNLK